MSENTRPIVKGDRVSFHYPECTHNWSGTVFGTISAGRVPGITHIEISTGTGHSLVPIDCIVNHVPQEYYYEI